MFDVGFWEICLIGIISLVVIGPERLPKVARMTGFWLGKIRSMTASVKAEMMEELHEQEIRQTLTKDSGFQEAGKILNIAQELKNELESGAHQEKEPKDSRKS